MWVPNTVGKDGGPLKRYNEQRRDQRTETEWDGTSSIRLFMFCADCWWRIKHLFMQAVCARVSMLSWLVMALSSISCSDGFICLFKYGLALGGWGISFFCFLKSKSKLFLPCSLDFFTLVFPCPPLLAGSWLVVRGETDGSWFPSVLCCLLLLIFVHITFCTSNKVHHTGLQEEDPCV